MNELLHDVPPPQECQLVARVTPSQCMHTVYMVMACWWAQTRVKQSRIK